MKRYSMEEVSTKLGVRKEFLSQCIQLHWLSPAEVGGPLLDDEDVARLRLIIELKQDLGVNDEAVPVILHLLDQLYVTLAVIRKWNPSLGNQVAGNGIAGER